MLRLHTLFVFLFFVFISAYGAQTYSVKGVVTSHATGEGLPFVSVGIWNTRVGYGACGRNDDGDDDRFFG